MSKKEQKYQINGRVVDEKTRRGLKGLRVEAWDKDRDPNDLVGSDETDADGRFRIGFDGSYFREFIFDREPDLFFKVFSDGEQIKSTEDSVLWNVRAGETSVEIAVPWAGGDARTLSGGEYVVTGTVASPDSASVGGLRVLLVDRNVGRDFVLAETRTDAEGGYRAGFAPTSLDERGKKQPDLQARVYTGQEFLAASDVRYNAAERETLNVQLPAKSAALPSEHETLNGALAAHYDGRLADLKESDERQDITYLANKTGWDARAVALTALADRFSRRDSDAAPAIKPAFYYALFRAGLPADPDTLYQADPGTVERVWKQAAGQGVIAGALEKEIGGAVEAFRRIAARKTLAAPALVGASSLKEMLTASRLEEAEQKRFAELHAAHRSDPTLFWREVGKEFGAEKTARLQLDGKLGFLTINNAPLVGELHRAADGGLKDPVELARRGFYRAEQWDPLLGDDVPIPKEVPGDTLKAKRRNYAEYLAAQVRLSYPTASIAEMVRRNDLPVRAPEQVHTFLTEHQGKFDLGMMPVEQYIARQGLDTPRETVAQVQKLQRVYQITATDEAMAGLMRRGVEAAAHVVRHDKETFVQTFAQDLGGAEVAAQTYDKSLQVHNAVLNIAVSYLTAKNGIVLGARSAGSARQASSARPLEFKRAAAADGQAGTNGQPAAADGGQVLKPAPKGQAAENASDVLAYPTLEGLFGEMDFCACDHCRSILSPAAYLVDLLHFIDQPTTEPLRENPQAVLLERRPDIEHLPLTCENTNTAMPYIDVVNETLEYFVANTVRQLSLDGYVGHDTDGAASADLLASPRFVMDSAYALLMDERFPPPLPFHQPLENLRRLFDKFEVGLPLAMEQLRQTDNLERGAAVYGWRDILMEELSLSRAEYEILTDSVAVPLWRMYGFPNGTTDADVIAALSNAKQFARRLGLTYEELVSILKTRFVNPNSDLIPKLERLRVPFAALHALKDGNITDAQFDALLPTGALALDPAFYGGDIKAWVKQQDNFDRITGIITLTDPTGEADPCDFGALEFRYPRPLADPDDTSTRLAEAEFIRLLRFIRLWRKLGWTIEQTNAAICALFPLPPSPAGADAIDTAAELDAGFLALLPRLGVAARVLKALNLTTKRDLLPLLACWSPLGTHGEGSLYRQMFLNPALLALDASFAENGSGEFLQDPLEKLLGHAEALRAAFALTGDEFSQIVAALGFDADSVAAPYNHPQPTLEQPILDAAPGIGYDDLNKQLLFGGYLSPLKRDKLKSLPGVSAAFKTAVDALFAANQAALTPLTLDNISAVYRRGWLARKLKLSVRELLLLTKLTGLDPFAAPDPTGPALPRLVELVQALKGRSLKSSAALYLIWNQDLSGKSAPKPEQVTDFARTLRADFAAIEDQFAATEDPNGDVARARMTLVYGADAAGTFFSLLDDTLTLDVAYTHAQPTLAPAIVAADAAIAYDDFRHRLSHAGLLGATKRDALKAVGGVTASFQDAVDALFARGEDARGSFFARFPELKPLYDAYVASADPPDVKRGALLAAFRPELSRRRKRQQVLQRFSAAANTDLDFTQAVLDAPSAPYPLHADGDAGQPALNDVLALGTQGLAAQFFFSDTATGPVGLAVPAAANLDYASGGGNPLPANPTPGAAVSGIWTGRVEAPETGFHNFVIEADAGATVTLSLGGQARALTRNGNVWRNNDSLELKAGTLYELVLTVNKVTDALSVKWETPKRPREVLTARHLYPPSIFPPFNAAYVRFLKAASLAQGLRLSASELTRFATDADYQVAGDGWLNVLAVAGDPAPATAAALLKPLRDLLDYARIKAELSPGDDALITALADPTAASGGGALQDLTRWDTKSLDALLSHFGGDVAGLTHFDQFRRAFDAFALARGMGISAGALIRATTNEPAGDTVRELQAALRARYEPADWRTVVQPINDAMRSLQRHALVAYILHRMRADPATEHIDTADKLFEYFLMDVQMEPCMQTSPIRHALSSVQLFIERCLMNLEPRVSPAAINAKQWEWMKRYRVWEANRKVFLFPENWAEPELRDDKSPFFKELESELLQSDITEESATVALLNYLAKLEEVAKLEPCGLYHAPADPLQRTGEIDHVIARTSGANRKHYYRRYEYGYWTPWELIKLEIEDNPVMPVVWRGRLLLFWLRILKQSPVDPEVLPDNSANGDDLSSLSLSDLKAEAKRDAKSGAKVTVQAVLCWSEYYNGKWQQAKTSDVNDPAVLGKFPPAGKTAFDRSKLQLSASELPGALSIHVSNQGNASFYLFNTHSLPSRRFDNRNKLFTATLPPSRALDTSGDVFTATYSDGLLHFTPTDKLRPVIVNGLDDRTVEPRHPLRSPWDAPFFYEDTRHAFFVTTRQEQRRVIDHPGFGITLNPNLAPVAEIPPLVLKREPPPRIGPTFGDPIGPDPAVIDTGPIRQFVTEDAFISRGLGTNAAVTFDGKQIGMSGAIADLSADGLRKL
ncbi:MAG TPA: neuraminidase-like domain-containing protein [Pyrinomonadaceae bacterium]